MNDNNSDLEKKKQAKKLANQRYYTTIKERLKTLDEIKNKKIQKEENEKDHFFLPTKTQTQAAPPQKEQQQQQPIYIQQQQQQPKQTLMNKVLETLVISTIPMVPLIIKQCLILYANKQPKQEIQPEQPSTHYSQQMNTLEF